MIFSPGGDAGKFAGRAALERLQPVMVLAVGLDAGLAIQRYSRKECHDEGCSITILGTDGMNRTCLNILHRALRSLLGTCCGDESVFVVR